MFSLSANDNTTHFILEAMINDETHSRTKQHTKKKQHTDVKEYHHSNKSSNEQAGHITLTN